LVPDRARTATGGTAKQVRQSTPPDHSAKPTPPSRSAKLTPAIDLARPTPRGHTAKCTKVIANDRCAENRGTRHSENVTAERDKTLEGSLSRSRPQRPETQPHRNRGRLDNPLNVRTHILVHPDSWDSYQAADQERQLTGGKPPDRICENPGSVSKGANQRAPDNRAESLPKSVPPPDCDLTRSEMVPPAGLWPSQVGDQERQLTCEELLDRICEKHGSFSKGANQRAPDNRAEPLPKRCHPPIAAGRWPGRRIHRRR
jgi:hypothetical protein